MTQSLVFGIHAVENACSAGQLSAVWIQQDSKNKRLQKLQGLLEKSNVPFFLVSLQELNKRCSDRHQGVIAEVQQLQIQGEKQLDAQLINWHNPLLLVLDQIEDPRNLGACLRSADAAGVTAVIMTKNNSAPITAIARKTAAGAVDHLPLFQVNNLARVLKKLKQSGIWIYGTDCCEHSQNLYQTELKGAIAIVMGNEGKGLRHLIKQSCDHLIHIPMAGEVQSLNVSVATGITLFEVVRQRVAC